jgi:uncharacterized membrane protein YphA (DoxX/SURF4 family)
MDDLGSVVKSSTRWATVATIALTALRVALGALFVISGFSKLQHPDLFVDAVQQYGLLPDALAEVFGTVLPWVELFLGCSLVLGIFSTLAAAMSAALALSFIVANVYSFFHPVGESCPCLGTLVNLSHTTALVIDIAMLFVASLLLYQRGRAGVVGIGHLLSLKALRLPSAARFALCSIIIGVAMVITFAQVPKEKPLWREGIDSALENGSVVVALFWKGDPSDFMDELRMVMEIEERYGLSVRIERIDAGVWDDAAKEFDVSEFPTTLVLEGKNNRGYVEYPQRFAGAEDREPLVAAIDEVLAGKP